MSVQPEQNTKPRVRLLRPQILWTIIRLADLVPTFIAFVILFCLASVVVTAAEPGITNVGDAAWFLYAVITTIGLGDYTCVTVVGRIATVALSLYSVFFLALLTGIVVSYCTERLKAERNESVAAFIDQLRRLPELSHEELVDLSERIKRL